MALTSALSEIVLSSFDPKTRAYKSVTLNNEHCVKIYGQYAKQCVDMLDNDYHKVFLTPILTQISKEGL
jgi:hypothetical protein